MDTDILKNIIDTKRQFHNHNASISFEEKVRQIIELQKIDMEFNRHRKIPRAAYMRVWQIDEK